MAKAKGSDHGPTATGPHPTDVDALFQLPLADFTAARNALAGRLKQSGQADLSARIKALPKPPVSAWAVNQVYWQDRAAFDRLIATGKRFRAAQAAHMAGKATDLRESLDERRQAIAAVTALAAGVLRERDQPPTEPTLRRMATTVEALSTYAGLPETPSPGRLIADVDPPGFEALATLVPRSPGAAPAGPSRVLTFQPPARATRPRARRSDDPQEAAQAETAERRAQLATARETAEAGTRALREAHAHARTAEAQAQKAAGLVQQRERAVRQADEDRAEAERRHEQAVADLKAAQRDARQLTTVASDAARAVAAAEAALREATQAVDDLS